jgi:hypothetical protein
MLGGIVTLRAYIYAQRVSGKPTITNIYSFSDVKLLMHITFIRWFINLSFWSSIDFSRSLLMFHCLVSLQIKYSINMLVKLTVRQPEILVCIYTLDT